MSERNPQNKKVVVLCASVACMGAPVVALHPMFVGIVIALQVVTLVLAIVELAKLKRQER